MSGRFIRPFRRALAAAAVLAFAAGASGCGVAAPAAPAPAATQADDSVEKPEDEPTGKPQAGGPVQISAEPMASDAGPVPPPAGVPASAWGAMLRFAELRQDTGRPLAEATGDPDCSLPGPGCAWPHAAETVVWSAASGTRALRTEVFTRWKAAGRTQLGWPISSEYRFGGDYRTDFQKGSLMYVPRLGRVMAYDPGVEKSAVVIGDSQAGKDTWVGKGLASLGYAPVILGAGGTGYTRGNGTVDSYPEALEEEEWLLPWGTPALVILQGGGNDAYGPSNQAIRHNAIQLIREVRRTYPESRIVVVGVIGSGSGRRGEIDDLMGRVATEQQLEFLSVKDWWSRYALSSKLEDGMHLGKAGHDAAAPVFARELKGILDRPRP